MTDQILLFFLSNDLDIATYDKNTRNLTNNMKKHQYNNKTLITYENDKNKKKNNNNNNTKKTCKIF